MKMVTSRRSFLEIGAASLFGLLARQSWAHSVSTTDIGDQSKSMILIWLDGGPATIDMWDPKPEAPEEVRGEFTTISTKIPGVAFTEPMSRIADVLDRCTLIRSMQHSIPEHGPGSEYVLTGRLPSPAIQYPSLGAVAARLADLPSALPPYIAFNNPAAGNAGFLGSAWNAFELDSDTAGLPTGLSLGREADLDHFSRRTELRDRLDAGFGESINSSLIDSLGRFHRDATRVLEQDSIRKAMSLDHLDEQQRQRFGNGQLANNLMRASRLVEAGARFVTVGYGGWDTHSNNFQELGNRLLPELDLALSELIKDLDESGRLDSTIVCCCGEFGRTPNINQSGGRDHWARAMSVLVAGGGFQRGHVHGATDKLGREPERGRCTPPDLFATFLQALGIESDRVLTTRSGRPIALVEGGEPIHGLFDHSTDKSMS